jgi:hypothetical protein
MPESHDIASSEHILNKLLVRIWLVPLECLDVCSVPKG